MTPYVAGKFTTTQRSLWATATWLVELIPDLDDVEWRCHEIARAVRRQMSTLIAATVPLKLLLYDGKCGGVEHSWLLVPGSGDQGIALLDVYVPGALPQVQLLDPFVLLPWGEKYIPGADRDDIREDDIGRILEAWSKKL